MRRVQILSPFRGNTPAERRRNVAYAQAALLDCLERGEAPFAPHLLYPAVLDESDPEQRAAMDAGVRAEFRSLEGWAAPAPPLTTTEESDR